MTPVASKPDHIHDSKGYVTFTKKDNPPLYFKVGSQPLITISSIRNLVVAADGKGVTIVLNADDTKKYSELTHKFKGGLLFYQVSAKPPVFECGTVTSPTEDGIIEFSEARGSGNIAEYLRHRFGK
jgi:hypothetical protein